MFRKNRGIKYYLKVLFNKLSPTTTNPIPNFDLYVPYFKNKYGLEIGGPSLIFLKEIPIYPISHRVDGCNFSCHTIWEGSIQEGLEYKYYRDRVGYQYISEASNLIAIQSNTYDFILASHCLEHCANAIATIKEWRRVLKPGGALLLILPDRRFTFDHRRPLTSMEHLIEDYENDIDERDLTHLKEIMELHDLQRDPGAGSEEEFFKRSKENYTNRCLHHHVFDFKLLQNLFDKEEIAVVDSIFVEPFHQVILGVKL